jgi:Carboxypeptidase regulatory-like domain/TonB dependent receptor-like, beta-barrel
MRLKFVAWLIVIGGTAALPLTGYAQEATVLGTVTDTTGGVLPGVTVRALHEASGNTFEAVTDERGAYRLPVRTGVYRMTAELAGFATATRGDLELLVGREAVVNLQMTPSTVQESVTVTGEAPLIDVTQSELSGNIDPRQMQELPLNGRNWMDLTLLAPGNRQNAVTETPGASGRDLQFQINIDGQQVTQMVATSFGQTRLSRDAIAEFEFVSNRFDASQGRSSGVQVNAISKSGTNTPSGTFSGFFRDDRFSAADFIQDRVLPFSNQQLSVTFGGPIRRDRIHIFGNYEYEREPQTFAYDSPFPRFNIDQTGTRRLDTGGVRLDAQFSPRTRLTVRGTKYSNRLPFDPRYSGGGIRHPSSAIKVDRTSNHLYVTFTQVLSNRALNEVKGGYAGFAWDQQSVVNWANHPQAAAGITRGAPSIELQGYTVGMTHLNTPQTNGDDPYSIRDDLTLSFTGRGRHNLKLGGEYIYLPAWLTFCNSCMGILDARGGPIPRNIEDLFPVWNDASTWNLAPLSPVTRRYTLGIGDFRMFIPKHLYAGWLQDDWQVTDRLTLNLGVRYDLGDGTFGESSGLLPFVPAGRPLDRNNLAPRLGFAWSLNDRTVVRGGFGQFFADVTAQPALWLKAWIQQVHPELLNDGRPDFAANPFNGPIPTFEEIERTLCSTRQEPGCFRRTIRTQLISPNAVTPFSYQTSLGVQRQFGDTMSFEADYVFTASRHGVVGRNINLSYNPATAANNPFTNVARLPFPDWGAVSMDFTEQQFDSHGLQTAFTKRLSQGWQMSATYTLSGLWDEDPLPINTFAGCTHPFTAPGICDVPVTLAPDLGGQRSLAVGDQRHRAVVNTIWEVGYGFQLSGLYFFGSGERFATTYGGDLRAQSLNPSNRLRPNGTIVPRNNFTGKAIHRVDLRIRRGLPLGGRVRVDGIAEVFNLLNHENFGSYVTQESNQRFGQPSFNDNVAYQPRRLQLGFRFAF